MSAEMTFTKEKLDTCLKEIAKRFRKLNGKATMKKVKHKRIGEIR